MKRKLLSGQFVVLYQNPLRPTGKARSGPPYCFDKVYRDCDNDDCYLVFGDGSVYHYLASAADAARSVTVADIHGEFFNAFMRRPTADGGAFERWLAAIPDSATLIYSYPPYAGTDPGACVLGFRLTVDAHIAWVNQVLTFTASPDPVFPLPIREPNLLAEPGDVFLTEFLAGQGPFIATWFLSAPVVGQQFQVIEPFSGERTNIVSVTVNAILDPVYSADAAAAFAVISNAGADPGDTISPVWYDGGGESYENISAGGSGFVDLYDDVLFRLVSIHVQLDDGDYAVAFYGKLDGSPHLVYGTYTLLDPDHVPGSPPTTITVTATP